MEVLVNISSISIFPRFRSRFNDIHWFYPYHSFKHSNWWRHEFGHTQYWMETYNIIVLIF